MRKGARSLNSCLTKPPGNHILSRRIQNKKRFMTLLKRSILVVTVLLSFLEFCRADPPNGTVSFSFDAATAPVWDLTGSYGLQQTIIGVGGAETALGFVIDVTQDDRGFLFGSGGTVVNG